MLKVFLAEYTKNYLVFTEGCHEGFSRRISSCSCP
jgi:hypothetical protein